jgi:hypothetical protein
MDEYTTTSKYLNRMCIFLTYGAAVYLQPYPNYIKKILSQKLMVA